MGRKKLTEAARQAESDLRYWGYYVGKQYAADGYPGSCTLLMLLSGHSDLNPLAEQFGVNCIDMPEDVWQINASIMRLRAGLRSVLIARYALPVDYASGQPIQVQVIAAALGLHVRMYHRMLEQARRQFLSFRGCIESMT